MSRRRCGSASGALCLFHCRHFLASSPRVALRRRAHCNYCWAAMDTAMDTDDMAPHKPPSLAEEQGDLIALLFLFCSLMTGLIRLLIAFYYYRKRRAANLAEMLQRKLSEPDYTEAMKAAVLTLPMRVWEPKRRDHHADAPSAAAEVRDLESLGAADSAEQGLAPGPLESSPQLSPKSGTTSTLSRLDLVLDHIGGLLSPMASPVASPVAEAPAPLELPAATLAAVAADGEASTQSAPSSHIVGSPAATSPAAPEACGGEAQAGSQRTFEDDGECTICMYAFEPGDELRTLQCGHMAFHAPCIDEWLISQGGRRGFGTCPLCKAVAIDVREATTSEATQTIAPAAMALIVDGVEQANLTA